MAVGVLAHSGSYSRVQELDRSRWLMVHETSPTGSLKPRLLDRVRETLRTHHYSRRTVAGRFRTGEAPSLSTGRPHARGGPRHPRSARRRSATDGDVDVRRWPSSPRMRQTPCEGRRVVDQPARRAWRDGGHLFRCSWRGARGGRSFRCSASGRVPGHRSGNALPGVTTAARRSTSCKDVGGRFRSAVPNALSCPSVGHQK